jgi:hypothetical protein
MFVFCIYNIEISSKISSKNEIGFSFFYGNNLIFFQIKRAELKNSAPKIYFYFMREKF